MKAGRTRQLKWKYFASYVVVMLIVMGLLLAYAYHSFLRLHSSTLLTHYRDSLLVVREQTEGLLTDLAAITGQMVSTDRMVPFEYRQEPEKTRQYSRRLSSYRATHEHLENIFIHFFDDPFIYSADAGYLLENFLREGFQKGGMEADRLNEAFAQTKK